MPTQEKVKAELFAIIATYGRHRKHGTDETFEAVEDVLTYITSIIKQERGLSHTQTNETEIYTLALDRLLNILTPEI